jgi:hypothetical protein
MCGRCQKCRNREIKVAVFFFEFDEPRLNGGHVGGNISWHSFCIGNAFDYTGSFWRTKVRHAIIGRTASLRALKC